ncbi:MAG TPA: hypothetical protein VEP30_06115 [Chthoniobacterales bacterium]|nr:hypothetical protein [Chthoniobacterales bacterium]
MTRRRKILITAAVVVVVAAAAYIVVPRIMFGISLGRLVRHQQAEIEQMRPHFNLAIGQRLRVGQSIEDAKKILSAAGLEFLINEEQSPPTLTSFYPPTHAEAGPGFLIELKIDNQNRISKIDIQEVTDMP